MNIICSKCNDCIDVPDDLPILSISEIANEYGFVFFKIEGMGAGAWVCERCQQMNTRQLFNIIKSINKKLAS